MTKRTNARTQTHVCPKHPQYQAKRAPTADCQPCREMYAAAHASAPRKAADLIAATISRGGTTAIPAPSAEAMRELRTILAHNDSASNGARVSARTAVELLQSYGWKGRSSQALDALCVRQLSRRSYARA